MLTEKEAWLFLADIWEHASTRPLMIHVNCCGRPSPGLCYCIKLLLTDGHISNRIAHKMVNRIDRELDRLGAQSYLYPFGQEGAKQRAEFCKTQAEKKPWYRRLFRSVQ
jgi:hypothetical protein